MSYQRQTGQTHPLLRDAPRIPDGCEQLWTDFLEMHACRGSTGMGPARITFLDIDAWQRVNRTQLPAWQIDAIRGADDAYMAQAAKRVKPT
jgi:hypothetical protein